MNSLSKGTWALVAIVFAVGCGHTRDLRAVAASELRCPTDQVVVHKGSKHGRDVSGCGLRAHYRYSEGEWTRDDVQTGHVASAREAKDASPVGDSSPSPR